MKQGGCSQFESVKQGGCSRFESVMKGECSRFESVKQGGCSQPLLGALPSRAKGWLAGAGLACGPWGSEGTTHMPASHTLALWLGMTSLTLEVPISGICGAGKLFIGDHGYKRNQFSGRSLWFVCDHLTTSYYSV